MSNYETKLLKPTLRFPEFRNAGEWNIELLRSLYSFQPTNSFSRDDLNYYDGSVKNIHYGDIHTKFPTLFDIKKEVVPFINSSLPIEKIKAESYCIEGDMIFADASEDLNDIGKSIELVNLDNEKLVSGMHTLLARQIESKLISGFGGYLFLSKGIRAQIQKEAQGTKVLGISSGRLSSIKVYYPESRIEQQKIADCLLSLDELINAESQKLDKLQAHKKGLMQQLFPAVGEAVPKLRFPQFRNTPKWCIQTLNQISSAIFDGTHQTPKYTSQGIPFFSVENLVSGNKNKFITKEDHDIATIKNKPEYGDILITRIGNIGFSKVIDWKYDFSIYVTLAVIKKTQLFNSYYLHNFFQSDYYQQEILSKSLLNAVPCKINMDELRKTKVLLPPDELKKEQEKIADCLSSLDDVVNAQIQKIEKLKEHKKGLMQRLFPSLTEDQN